MSSDVVARVLAFEKKADALYEKGHFLRAAENYGLGAEAARTLGTDNLVAAHMLLRRGEMFSTYAMVADTGHTAEPCALAAFRSEFLTLLSGVVEALERRRVAGTLLEGKCAAAEEAWRAAWGQRQCPPMLAAEAARLATLVGYEQFLHAASICLSMLKAAVLFAAECSDAQFQSFAQHAAHAAELMQQTQHHDVVLGTEANFARKFPVVVAQVEGSSSLDVRLVQLLAGAWQRLQSSGVPHARGVVERVTTASEQQITEFLAAAHGSLTVPGLRRCALPGCGAKEAHPAHFKSCAACRIVVYCCREHQVAGWPAHKKACKAARKASAAEEAGPSGA